MKRLFKALLKLLLLVIVVGGGLAVQVIWFRPFSIDLFFEKVFLEYALEDPELLTSLRILEPLGLESHNENLTDASPRRQLQLQAKVAQDLESLRAYDYESLDDDQKLSYDVLEYYLDMAVQGQAWDFHNYPVNPLNGVQSALPAFLVSEQQVVNKSNARHYINRLDKFPEKFDQVMESLVHRQELGILPPRFAIDEVLAEMTALVDTPPQQHVLFTSLKEKLESIDRSDMDPVTKRRMLNRVEKALKEKVQPAYRSLIEYFETLQSQVDGNHGAWALPDGEAFYAYRVRLHTTTDMTPDMVHELGLSEVDRIEAEMETLLSGEGLTEGSVGERLANLCRDKKFLYPDIKRVRRQIIADYQEIVDEISGQMEPHFNRLPSSGVEVVRIPAFKQETSTTAYYRPPSLDGERPGRFFVNLRDVQAICKLGMRTLAYHEAVPGHHFHLSIKQEMTGVPTFRRVIPFTAFTEGWALYAERLAWELGFQDDPFDDLGRLQAEMFRAVRLVVDTGLHQRQWTREQAIDYMIDKTGYAERDVIAEVERYLINPGQALAYKIGMEKILELRELARKKLGASLDIRDFHSMILANGDLPLGILQQEVDRWIADRRPIGG